jgi:hypothetical protein
LITCAPKATNFGALTTTFSNSTGNGGSPLLDDHRPHHPRMNRAVVVKRAARGEREIELLSETTATPLPCDQLRFVRLHSRQELDRLFDQRA